MPRSKLWLAATGFLAALAIVIVISILMDKVWMSRSQAPAPVGLAGAGIEGWGGQTREMSKPPRVLFDNDGYYWIQYAQQMASDGSLRVRWTDLDNVPYGRPVHWSSGLLWLMVGLAWGEKLLFHTPMRDAIENAGLYVDPLLLAILLAGLSWALWRRAGGAISAAVVLTVASLPVIGWDFAYGRPDHHGLHDFAALGALLCLVLGGAGWVSPPVKTGKKKKKTAAPALVAAPLHLLPTEQARRWMTASGIFCGIGLWIGATQQTVVIGSIGLGVLLGLLLLRTNSEEEQLDPILWRYWTLSGVGTGLFFYLVEYFPNHIAMRLEVNHPFYLLGLACGGEVLHQISRLRVAAKLGNWPNLFAIKDPAGRKRTFWILGVCMIGGLVLPAAILFGSVEWHSLRDPYMRRVHDYIIEFEPLSRLHKGRITEELFRYFGLMPLLFILILALWRRLQSQEKMSILACTIPSLVLVAWTLLQARWAALADTALICLLVATLAPCWRLTMSGTPSALAARFAAIAIFALPIWCVCAGDLLYYNGQRQNVLVADKLAQEIANRDVALNLKRLAAVAPIRVMSAMGLTPSLQYFGGIAGTGSLYWENMGGVHASTDFFADYGDEEARKIVLERGITHVLIEESPATAEVAHWTKYGRREPDSDIERTLAYRLASPTGTTPDWLEPVPYYSSPFARQFRIRIYRVLPDKLTAPSHH